jgi:hypothetical protein
MRVRLPGISALCAAHREVVQCQLLQTSVAQLRCLFEALKCFRRIPPVRADGPVAGLKGQSVSIDHRCGQWVSALLLLNGSYRATATSLKGHEASFGALASIDGR